MKRILDPDVQNGCQKVKKGGRLPDSCSQSLPHASLFFLFLRLNFLSGQLHHLVVQSIKSDTLVYPPPGDKNISLMGTAGVIMGTYDGMRIALTVHRHSLVRIRGLCDILKKTPGD